MVYGAPIQYVTVSYLRLFSVFATLVAMGIMEELSTTLIIIYSIFVVALMMWPLAIAYWLLKNHEKLTDPAFHSKFKALYNGIRVISFQAILYKAFFAVRRFDIVLDNIVFN